MDSSAEGTLNLDQLPTSRKRPAEDEEPPTDRRRLRSTPLSEPEAKERFDLETETAKLKLTTSFRSLAMKLIGAAESTELEEYRKLSSLIKEWSTAAQSEGQLELQKLLRSEIEGCYRFFTSYQSVMDGYFQDCPYLSNDQLKKLNTELNAKLEDFMNNLKLDQHFLTTLCNGVLATIISNIEARNQDIIRTEELLAEMTCQAAFEAYTKNMHRQHTGKVLSELDIHRYHVEIMNKVVTTFSKTQEEDSVVWKSRLADMKQQMKQYCEDLVSRNVQDQAQLRKTTMDAFQACQKVFDGLFDKNSAFGCLADVKKEGELAMNGAEQKLKEIQRNLSPTAITEVRQMMQNYAVRTLLDCSSDSPHAAAVFAKKSHVTIIFCYYDVSKSVVICCEGMEPIMLDPRFWLHDGHHTLIDFRAASKCEGMSEYSFWAADIFDFIRIRMDEFGYNEHDDEDLQFKALLGSCEYPEQIIAVYLKEVKKYLLEVCHLIPTKVTVVVEDWTTFKEKHRINSAIRLAGLPSSNFMLLSGATTAGYIEKNDMDINCKFWFSSEKCELKIGIPVSPTTTTDVTDLEIDFSSVKHVSDLVIAGIEYVSKYSKAAYSESYPYDVTLHCQDTSYLLAESKTCIEQNVSKLVPMDCQATEENQIQCDIQVSDEDPEIHFQIPASDSKKLVALWKLRKDGILCEPEIRDRTSGELVSWEMTGDLMPWNHQDFKNARDPERDLGKLTFIESMPLKLISQSWDL